jgi:hypothetical protein
MTADCWTVRRQRIDNDTRYHCHTSPGEIPATLSASSRQVFAATRALDLTPSLSRTPSKISRVQIGACIDPASFLHECLKPHPRLL